MVAQVGQDQLPLLKNEFWGSLLLILLVRFRTEGSHPEAVKLLETLTCIRLLRVSDHLSLSKDD